MWRAAFRPAFPLPMRSNRTLQRRLRSAQQVADTVVSFGEVTVAFSVGKSPIVQNARIVKLFLSRKTGYPTLAPFIERFQLMMRAAQCLQVGLIEISTAIPALNDMVNEHSAFGSTASNATVLVPLQCQTACCFPFR